MDRLYRQFAPEADEEKRLTQSIADTLWRLERIPSLEAGIYAIGRRELAAQFADESDEAVRKAMIEAQIFLSYRRDLNNLSIQEGRLRRLYEKDEAELKRLLAQRREAVQNRETAERGRWYSAIIHLRAARQNRVPFDPAELGFEFSAEEVEAREQQELLNSALHNGSYYRMKSQGQLKLLPKTA